MKAFVTARFSRRDGFCAAVGRCHRAKPPRWADNPGRRCRPESAANHCIGVMIVAAAGSVAGVVDILFDGDFSGHVQRSASGGEVNWLSELPIERAPAVDLSQVDLA